MQETLDPVREPGAIAVDSACPCVLEQSSRVGDEARIPLGDTARIEDQPTDGRIGLDRTPYFTGVGYRIRVALCAAPFNTRDVGPRALDVHGPWALHRGRGRISAHATRLSLWSRSTQCNSQSKRRAAPQGRVDVAEIERCTDESMPAGSQVPARWHRPRATPRRSDRISTAIT